MKKQSYALGRRIRFMAMGLVVSMGAAFVSCSEDDKEELVNKDPFAMEVEVPAAGETKEVTVEAVANWKLSTTNSSMIKINSALVGSAGNVKIEFTVNPNNGFTSRSAELNFTDSRNNVIKVVQAGANPDMNFSKPVAVTYDANKGLFTDTVVVTSNLAWELPELPEWVEEMKIIKGQPQAGTMTEVTLVVIAKQDLLKQAGNTSKVVLASKNGTDFGLDITFAGFTPKIEFDVEKVIMDKDILNSNQFIGHVTIKSNVKWTLLQNEIAWLDETDMRENKSQNAVETFVKLFFTMDAQKLDTDGLNGTISIKDIYSEFNKSIQLQILPVEDDYILVKSGFRMADDAVIPAKNDPDKPSGTISVFGKNAADFQPAVFVMDNGRLKESRMPVAWVEQAPATRAALDRVDWHVYPSDRMESESYSQMNPFIERTCVIVFLHKSMFSYGSTLKEEYMDFDADWNGFLKEEYFINEVMYRQQGLTAEAPVFNLMGVADGGSLTLKANGGSDVYSFESNFNIDREGIFTLPGEIDWCEIWFDTEKGTVEFKTKQNTTGKARNQKVEFLHGLSNDLLFTVTIVQPAN